MQFLSCISLEESPSSGNDLPLSDASARAISQLKVVSSLRYLAQAMDCNGDPICRSQMATIFLREPRPNLLKSWSV